MNKWKRVAWLDELQFLIYHIDGHVRVPHLHALGMAFSWATLGPLIALEKIMKATDYLSISSDHLLLYMVSVFPTLEMESFCRITPHVLKFKLR
ncbi:hypothetical protein TNCV_882521 [Trichonephila clavipes]|nr:hypothetical protein TNCV_882521 [Trichonephila clavipes]